METANRPPSVQVTDEEAWEAGFLGSHEHVLSDGPVHLSGRAPSLRFPGPNSQSPPFALLSYRPDDKGKQCWLCSPFGKQNKPTLCTGCRNAEGAGPVSVGGPALPWSISWLSSRALSPGRVGAEVPHLRRSQCPETLRAKPHQKGGLGSTWGGHGVLAQFVHIGEDRHSISLPTLAPLTHRKCGQPVHFVLSPGEGGALEREPWRGSGVAAEGLWIAL